MSTNNNFPHLELISLSRGQARLPWGGEESEQTKTNKLGKPEHSQKIQNKIGDWRNSWHQQMRERNQDISRPTLPSSVPIQLEIDPELTDIDYLRSTFNFEVVSELDNGFVIVASEDTNLDNFLNKASDFSQSKHGSGNVAKIHNLSLEIPKRLDAILDEKLKSKWENLDLNAEYVVEVGIECQGTLALPKELAEKKVDEEEDRYALKVAKYNTKREEYYRLKDNLMIEREQELERFIRAYDGSILDMFEGTGLSKFADSFTARIQIKGAGLKDLALNYPFIFEINTPEEFEHLFHIKEIEIDNENFPQPFPPDENSPIIGIIDSGIQEGHRLISSAIKPELSRSFVDPDRINNVADEVSPSGHGTRVAGAVLYPQGFSIEDNQYKLPCYIANIRVLDSSNLIPEKISPSGLLNKITSEYYVTHGIRIFNHSIGASVPCRFNHMSSWAAMIDKLSFENDVLFVQSAGNIGDEGTGPRTGILDYIRMGKGYPDYLYEAASRISNPAQSLNALTVGSICLDSFNDGDRTSFGGKNQPSSFSRTGLGIWGAIKPDVVEYGGDMAYDGGFPPALTTPPNVCPELIRSSLTSVGPETDRDEVGTSFSTPKVTAIAAQLARMLPEEPTLLYRALIANAARWPEGYLDNLVPDILLQKLRSYGYGLVNMERSLSNNPYRVTLISSGTTDIKAREAHTYKVPIPAEMRTVGDEYDILIEMTLSFAANPRRTRKSFNNYLSIWVDWKTSHLGESQESFDHRIFKESNGRLDRAESIPWKLGNRDDHNQIKNAKRNKSTLQKDWAVVKSHDLPDEFYLGIIGHSGWSKDPNDVSKYALTISFEAINRDIEIYNMVKVEVERLHAQAHIEIDDLL